MSDKIICEFCGRVIPPERLRILPGTRCCVRCSDTIPYSEEDMLGFAIAEQDDSEKESLEAYEEEF